jgi:hypothetical protein
VRLHLPGTAIVRAHGARSGKTASAPVRVLLFSHGTVFGHGSGGWPFLRAGYTSPAGAADAPATVVSAPRDEQPSNTPALAAAGLGAMALAGVLITRRQVRRRRKS